MAGPPFESARIEDLERSDGWAPIRQRFDVQAFGINAWTAHEAGAAIIPEHDEVPSRHEELYVVTAGTAIFTIEGTEVPAPAGTAVFVRDPAAKRGAVAVEADTTVVAVGGEPGEAFRPRSWETNADVLPLLNSGEYAEAKRLLTEALDKYDDRAVLLYNLACAEALLGQKDAAFEHLREAVEQRPDLAEGAGEDSDLASIRDDPRFAEVVGRTP